MPFGVESADVKHSMLRRLIPRLGSYGAITLVALYAICVVMPSIALAFPSGSAPSHCLTVNHHGTPEVRLQDGIHIPTLGDSAIDKYADNSMNGGDSKLKCHARMLRVFLLRRYNHRPRHFHSAADPCVSLV